MAYAGGIGAIAMVLASGAIRCPFATLTHQPCPGCGSTRAIRALFHLHIADAFRLNPVAPIVAMAVGCSSSKVCVYVAREGHARELGLRGASRWAIYALIAATCSKVPIWALRFFGLFGGLCLCDSGA